MSIFLAGMALWLFIGALVTGGMIWADGELTVGSIPIVILLTIIWPLALVFIFVDYTKRHSNKKVWSRNKKELK